MGKATAIANANIALIKYWGKRDSKLILPHNSSISMTCSGLTTTTTVEFDPKYEQDTVLINNEELKNDDKNVLGHLERIRNLAGIKGFARVVSETNFPVAAGLASSASGLAAVTLAAITAAGLKLGEKELTQLARQGSGSASRSISEGFVEWHRGQKEDGSDSYAEALAKNDWWPNFRMLVTIVTEAQKKVGSRAGMSKTVANCPYYKGWLESIEEDLKQVREGIQERDFEKVGSTAEYNCLKMHATMMTTRPSIIYWQPATLEIMHAVQFWREEGLSCYFTIDAGPNVKVMCLEKDQKELEKRLRELSMVKDVIVCGPGEGARLTDQHLF